MSVVSSIAGFRSVSKEEMQSGDVAKATPRKRKNSRAQGPNSLHVFRIGEGRISIGLAE